MHGQKVRQNWTGKRSGCILPSRMHDLARLSCKHFQALAFPASWVQFCRWVTVDSVGGVLIQC